jgi:deazaflavin-dependent oxidoreductase (nitroreductase family)
MPLHGDYEPSTEKWVRDQVEAYEASGGTEALTLRDTGLPVIILTTLGARSGKIRKTPLMRVEHDGRYLAVGSQGGAPTDPHWVRNLREHPQVELQDRTRKWDMTARELFGDERAQWWERAVAAFPNYADYQKRTDRTIPVFLLEPVAEIPLRG